MSSRQGDAGGGQTKMLVKFENKSNRVKGLAFHPQRPWILASLHNGCVQLWDYRMAVLIDKFEEHDGPVRGIDFHSTQPLFVSGGDDYKIKVWNYQQRKCLFNLLGHLDYIRTVQFHKEYPWILSASDDQTLRIWNWQNRQCLQVLTGHNHYIMCAQFHPTEDLLLSASLDQTVRVWDITGLRKKTVTIATDIINAPGGNAAQPGGVQTDLFGGSDVVVKHVLEGHTRGINWASFHPKLPLVASGADDREVKLWRMNERKAWEVDTMRGHMNNVSCVVFHPRKEMIVSNSEDKSIRVWDISKAQSPRIYRRDHDRYWILTAHPKLNLMAAGHDSGLLIFKLERERPPFDVTRKTVYYYKDTYIRALDVKTGKDTPLISTPGRRTTGGETYTNLMYNTSNKSQHCVLLNSDAGNTHYYELYVMDKKGSGQLESHRGVGKSAVFVSRNRFAVLDSGRKVHLKDLSNTVKKQLQLPKVHVHSMYAGGVGRLVFRTSDSMMLFDCQVMKEIAAFPVSSRHPVKYVVWSPAHKYCALMSKANVYVVDANFNKLCSINENSRIKSGAWDANGVFVYTTATHIKYLLTTGDSGIIRTLDTPIYITHVGKSELKYLDRDVEVREMSIDNTEYLFKVALVKRNYKEVLRIMKSNRLVGQSITAYLHKKGFPEVALHFVNEIPTKFSLALECGNIAVALECAQQLDQPACWHKLGVEALRQGNHQVVEAAYQKNKNFERLSFLYLITGNMEKLGKMLHIATLRQDVMGRYHNALYLGNVEERIRVLMDANQGALAYITAVAHGLHELADQIREQLGPNVPEVPPQVERAALFSPPMPILKEANWPLLEVSKGYFDGPAGEIEDLEQAEASDEDELDDDGLGSFGALGGGGGGDGDDTKPKATDGWDDLGNLGAIGLDDDAKASGAAAAAAAGGGWGDTGDLLGDLGIDLGDTGAGDATAADDTIDSSDIFVLPQAGKSPPQWWQDTSTLAADLIAAGGFAQAMHLLHRQIGVVNFVPLKPYFLEIYNAARVSVPSLPGCESTVMYLERTAHLPTQLVHLSNQVAALKLGFKAVTDGQLNEAERLFVGILQAIPFVVLDKSAELKELRDLINVSREYLTAIRLELWRRGEQDPARQLVLAAYFTHRRLQPKHVMLGLKLAIKAAFAIKNFKVAAGFCRRVLEMAVSQNKAAIGNVDVKQIKGILKACDGKEDETPIDYQDDAAFDVCCASMTAIHRDTKSVKCPYCASPYLMKYDGQVCQNCGICKIGAEVSGLQAITNQTD